MRVASALAAFAIAVLAAAPSAAQALPELRLTPHDVEEGTPTTTVDVIVTTPPDKPARFRVRTADGTARAGEDYVSIDRRIETATFTTIRIVIVDDNFAETSETFYVDISEVENAVAETTRVAITIKDPAILPAPEFGQTRAVEGDNWRENVVNVFITAPQVVQVAYSLRVFSTHITTNNADFERIDTIITFRPGQKTVTLPVTIFGDKYDEEDETFRLTLEGTASTAIFTIEDDDDPNTLPDMFIDDVTVFERTGQPVIARFRVSLSAPGVDGASVRYRTREWQAEEGTDYTGERGVVRFEPGQVLQWIEIEVAGDDLQENPEWFEVLLSDAAGADLEDEQALAAIRDDDAPAGRELRIHDAIAVERTGTVSYAVFRLELSSPSTEPIDVQWAAADVDHWVGERALRGRDYAPLLSSIRFHPGEVLKEIPVAIYGDSAPERTEYFGLYARGGNGITELPRPGTAIIIDDDHDWARPQLLLEDLSVIERDERSAVHFRLTLARPATAPATVVVTTRDISAEAGSDFDHARVTVTFAPGETEKNVELRLRGDDVREPLELFEIRLTDAVGLTLIRDSAIISIVDDDGPTRKRGVRH